MTTKTKAITQCDNPVCDKTHEEGEHVIPRGWASLNHCWKLDGNLDFCSIECLFLWAKRRVDPLGEPRMCEVAECDRAAVSMRREVIESPVPSELGRINREPGPQHFFCARHDAEYERRGRKKRRSRHERSSWPGEAGR